MIKLLNSNPIKEMFGYSKREPIPVDKKKAVRERAGNKCEICHKKPYGVTLEFHHKNMRNSDNSLSNIMLLCPNHHSAEHGKKRRITRTDILGQPHTRVVRKPKPRKNIKKPRSRTKSTRRSDLDDYLKHLA